MSKVQPNQAAKEIAERIKFITVATVDENGQPWNTPVAGFHFDNDYTLYWASWSENKHSRNIRHNGKAFIVIYDSTPADKQPSEGVYILAEASELSDEQEIMQAADVFKNDQYNPSDGNEYMGSKPRRIYKAVPQKIWLDPEREHTIGFFDDFEIDPELIDRTGGVTLFNSDNDMDGVQKTVEILRDKIKGIKYKEFHNYGHFLFEHMGTHEFPELLEEVLL